MDTITYTVQCGVDVLSNASLWLRPDTITDIVRYGADVL